MKKDLFKTVLLSAAVMLAAQPCLAGDDDDIEGSKNMQASEMKQAVNEEMLAEEMKAGSMKKAEAGTEEMKDPFQLPKEAQQRGMTKMLNKLEPASGSDEE